MKQEEKNQQSREKILHAAILEFGKKGYDGASLNALLSGSGLSKGLVYHYFENKDQIYLACVKVCFDKMTEVLSDAAIGKCNDAEAVLRSYFNARGRFLMEHPCMARIYLDALLQPPVHLLRELAEARSGFESMNETLFKEMLGGLPLREGLTKQEALDYFILMQSALHLQFVSCMNDEPDNNTASSYEERAHKAVELLLYGVAGRDER